MPCLPELLIVCCIAIIVSLAKLNLTATSYTVRDIWERCVACPMSRYTLMVEYGINVSFSVLFAQPYHVRHDVLFDVQSAACPGKAWAKRARNLRLKRCPATTALSSCLHPPKLAAAAQQLLVVDSERRM